MTSSLLDCLKTIRSAMLMCFCVSALYGCSGSSDSVDAQPGGQSALTETTNGGDGNTDESPNEVADSANSDATNMDTVSQTPTDDAAGDSVLSMSSTTRVDFDITVPAYMSDELQVQLSWGEINTTAMWVRDESWAISETFPVNTENLLVVTFSDQNGALTLGTVEQNFKTGMGDAEVLQIAASQFNIDRWDADGDGVSNLTELITGTDPQVSDNTQATPDAAPEPFQIAIEVLPVKTFKISWEPANGATRYRVLENQTGQSGYEPVSAELASTIREYDHRVALYKSLNARYMVEACNSLGCTSSNEVSVAETLSKGIGTLSSSDPEETIGAGVAISADGNTLAYRASRRVEPAPEDNRISPFSAGVYVHTLEDGIWQQQAFLEASNGDVGDRFGYAMSISRDGTVLAVGAQSESSGASGVNGNQTDNSVRSAGAVYVFTLQEGGWQHEAYIKSSDPAQLVSFGRHLDLSADGKTLAITSPYDKSGASGINDSGTEISVLENDLGWTVSGAIYVFTRISSGWQQQARIRLDSEPYGLGGTFVSLSGNGNVLATSGPYVFSRSDGVWRLDTYLDRTVIGALRGFGAQGTLSDDGSTLVLAATNDTSRATGINPPDRFTDATLDTAGGVHVFGLVDGNWAQQAYIKPSVVNRYTRFGSAMSVSTDGNTLAVFSRENTVGTGIFNDYTSIDSSVSLGSPDRTGAVYVFQRRSGQWSQDAYIKPAKSLFSFGESLAIDGAGDTLVIPGRHESGAVFLY